MYDSPELFLLLLWCSTSIHSSFCSLQLVIFPLHTLIVHPYFQGNCLFIVRFYSSSIVVLLKCHRTQRNIACYDAVQNSEMYFAYWTSVYCLWNYFRKLPWTIKSCPKSYYSNSVSYCLPKFTSCWFQDTLNYCSSLVEWFKMLKTTRVRMLFFFVFPCFFYCFFFFFVISPFLKVLV